MVLLLGNQGLAGPPHLSAHLEKRPSPEHRIPEQQGCAVAAGTQHADAVRYLTLSLQIWMTHFIRLGKCLMDEGKSISDKPEPTAILTQI